ncbi:MAG: DUF177 domain-containing protein [Paracoccaceae bacterium]
MPNSNTDLPWSSPLLVADLPAKKTIPFDLELTVSARQLLAQELGLTGLRKLRFTGTLTPLDKSDWQLNASLGATVVQSCVITLAPVTTRIDETVTRSFVGTLPDIEVGSETEMPVDDTIEEISDVIDPGAVMLEALALALPQFPRAPDASLTQNNFTEPGKAALSDADARPFSQLKALRDGLKKDTE